MPDRVPQPGDPDFDWSQYAQWKAAQPDVVAQAKETLAKTAPTAERFNLIDKSAPGSAASDPTGNAFADYIYSVGKGIPQGALNTITSLPSVPGDFLAGAKALATDPVETVKGALQGAGYIGKEAISGENPELMGQLIGTGLTAPAVGRAAVSLGPEALAGAGRGIAGAGEAMGNARPFGGMSIPGLGLFDAIIRSDPKGLALAAAPPIMRGVGGAMRWTGENLGALRDFLSSGGQAASEVDPYMPNVGGAPSAGAGAGARPTVPYASPTEAPPPGVDRYAPNISGTPTSPSPASSGPGVPYATPSEAPVSPTEAPSTAAARELLRDQQNLSRVMKWREAQDRAKAAAAAVERAKTGMEPQPIPSVKESISTPTAAGKASFTRTWTPPEEEPEAAPTPQAPRRAPTAASPAEAAATFAKTPPTGTPAGDIYSQWLQRGSSSAQAVKMAAKGIPPTTEVPKTSTAEEVIGQATKSVRQPGLTPEEQSGLTGTGFTSGIDPTFGRLGPSEALAPGVSDPALVDKWTKAGVSPEAAQELAAGGHQPIDIPESPAQSVLKFFKTPQGAAGQNYRLAKEAAGRGDIPTADYAREANLREIARKQTPQQPQQDWIQQQYDLIDKIKALMASQGQK